MLVTVASTTVAVAIVIQLLNNGEVTRLKKRNRHEFDLVSMGWALLLLVPSSVNAGEHRRSHSVPPPETDFQKVTLNAAPGEPIGLAVLPDGRVLHTTRGGRVWLHDAATGFNTVAADVPVYSHDEEGLQGIAVDPHFRENHWVYIYYSPPLDTPLDDPSTPTVNEGDAPEFGSPEDFAPFNGYMQLARFKLVGSSLDLSSEQKILQVPANRGICCHVGGDIDFDREGNLYLSTGDDTNPFDSDGFNPIDWRPGRNPAFDAARSAGNTNDLRGKLLRIRVLPNGRYVIPRGNLFHPRTRRARPEIYAMGLRNPFRFSVDKRTGAVYVADYSPDAPVADPLRGPAGTGRWMVIQRPGNYGWPFCATAELPYWRFDFETQSSIEPFDCAAPVNDSPNNTGRRRLPPVVQPQVFYGADPSSEFPELGSGGVGPMGGPVYYFDKRLNSSRKWPQYFDGTPLFYEWTRDALFEFRLRSRRRHQAQLDSIAPLLPSMVFENPIDMEFGPDGALYVLEYGEGYFGENPEAQLSRVDYVRGNASPVAVATSDVEYGLAPLTVQLYADGSYDPDGDALEIGWDFDSDGVVDSTDVNPVVTYSTPGRQTPTLRVVDPTGNLSTAAVRLVVGNYPPQVSFDYPVTGQSFQFGDTVSYSVSVSDDTPVDCSRVVVQYVLGHDDHGHPLSTATGCTGQFETAIDPTHVGTGNVLAVFVASYTDAPEIEGVPPLTGQALALLFPAPPPPPPPDEEEPPPDEEEPPPDEEEPPPDDGGDVLPPPLPPPPGGG